MSLQNLLCWFQNLPLVWKLERIDNRHILPFLTPSTCLPFNHFTLPQPWTNDLIILQCPSNKDILLDFLLHNLSTKLIGLKVQKASKKGLALLKGKLELPLRPIEATQMTTWPFWTRQERLEIHSPLKEPKSSPSHWNTCVQPF